jgi:hypothetical protein
MDLSTAVIRSGPAIPTEHELEQLVGVARVNGNFNATWAGFSYAHPFSSSFGLGFGWQIGKARLSASGEWFDSIDPYVVMQGEEFIQQEPTQAVTFDVVQSLNTLDLYSVFVGADFQIQRTRWTLGPGVGMREQALAGTFECSPGFRGRVESEERLRPVATPLRLRTGRGLSRDRHQSSRYAKISGATIVASDSITNIGVVMSSLPQVIFSVGTAPE